MQQKQPRERIIRPPQPEPQVPQNGPLDDGLEDLTQDELNNWLTQKVIRLELAQYEQEQAAGTAPIAMPPKPTPIIGKQKQAKPQVTKQPYQEMYDPNAVVPPKKKRSLGRTIALFVGLVIVAILIINIIAILVLNYQLPF